MGRAYQARAGGRPQPDVRRPPGSPAARAGVRAGANPNGEAAMSLIVEIRAAEGGEDAKLLVMEQAAIYRKLEARGSL